ncbi:MAG: helix-turn-helix domain-containing protein [Verrucomicrobiota bacterium]
MRQRDDAPRHPTLYGVPRDSAESIRLHYRAAPPGKRFHYHPQFELVMIRGSFGKRMVASTLSGYGEVDVVLLGPNLPHVWLADPLSPSDAFMDYSVVHFDRESLGTEFLNKPELTPVRELLHRGERGVALTGIAAAREAEEIVERIFSTEGLERLLNFYSLLLFMARTEQSQTLLDDAQAPPPIGRDQELFNRVIAYMHDHSTSTIRLAEIAKHVHMTVPSFTRFFRRVAGTSFVAYLNEWRIRRACLLLEETDLPIIAISTQVGYDNLSHFNRQFRKVTGTTPTAYRRDARRR